MKEKIKKWVSQQTVFMVVFAVTAVYMFCTGELFAGLLCLGIAICNLALHLEDKLIEELSSRKDKLYNLAKECHDNERNAVNEANKILGELVIEKQRHLVTSATAHIYKNKADFMQRKKSLSSYLKLDKMLVELRERRLRVLREMLCDTNGNNGKKQEEPKE